MAKSMISVEMQPFSVSTFLVGIVMAKETDWLIIVETPAVPEIIQACPFATNIEKKMINQNF
ncbi:MAG: hypothetical protein GDA56_16990 [Hormoscilla sp. GM7CHS1pb]|nr:hypothetical protein [Hormoscilla sp. GM7CHS1pb]